jgi:hypothetical protein
VATSAALVFGAMLLFASGSAQAADGSGTMEVAPTSVIAGSGGNALTFTYTAAEAMTDGEVRLTVPAGWTEPSSASVTASAGTLSISDRTIVVSALTLAGGDQVQIGYGAATAPTATGQSIFAAQEKSTADGTPTDLASSPAVTVAPAGLNSFLVTATDGGPVGAQTAGQSFAVKLTAQDQYANTETDFGGTVTVSSNRTCSAGCGTSAAFSSGVLAAHALTLTQAGSGAIVTVTRSGGSEGGSSNSFEVVPAAADHLTLTSSTASLAAGSSRTLTAEIDDAFGNRIDSTASVTFAQTAGTGTVSGLGSVSASGGVATRAVTGVKAGIVSIQASSSGIAAATITFTVVPGAADHLTLTGSTADLAAGSSRTLTAEIEDAFENTVDSTASVTFAKTGGNGAVTGLGSSSASGGTAGRQVTGDKWGAVTIRASSNGVTAASISFKIVPGAAKRLVFTMSTGKLKLGGSALLAVEIQDAHGNRVPSPAKSVTFAQAAGAGRVGGLGKVRSEAGVAWALIDALKKGSIQLKATVPGLTTAKVKFQVVK